jgi:DNA replication protein DnaC
VRSAGFRESREEYQHQRQKSLEYRIKNAGFPEIWSLETFPFDRQPGVHAATIRQLASLDFVPNAQNLVFIGPTGVGKTGLATGLLYQALVNGYRGRFIRAQDLFDEMYASNGASRRPDRRHGGAPAPHPRSSDHDQPRTTFRERRGAHFRWR